MVEKASRRKPDEEHAAGVDDARVHERGDRRRRIDGVGKPAVQRHLGGLHDRSAAGEDREDHGRRTRGFRCDGLDALREARRPPRPPCGGARGDKEGVADDRERKHARARAGDGCAVIAEAKHAVQANADRDPHPDHREESIRDREEPRGERGECHPAEEPQAAWMTREAAACISERREPDAGREHGDDARHPIKPQPHPEDGGGLEGRPYDARHGERKQHADGRLEPLDGRRLAGPRDCIGAGAQLVSRL